MSVSPRALPVPVIDPSDVQTLVPGISLEDAERAACLATLALEAVLYPNTIPDPLPPPVYAVTLAAAGRIARAQQGGASGPVVSESIGSYTYRIATPPSPDGALLFTATELSLLLDYSGKGSVYDVSVAGAYGALPVDWWQRNLDQPQDE